MVASFADLLLNRPVALPKGRKRSVSFEDEPKKNIGGSPEVVSFIWQTHLRDVFNALKAGAETANQVVEVTGISMTTVRRAITELIETKRVHCVTMYSKAFYAPVGRQPTCSVSKVNKTCKQILDALQARGGAGTTVQLVCETGIADTTINKWMTRLLGQGVIRNASIKKPAIWTIVEK